MYILLVAKVHKCHSVQLKPKQTRKNKISDASREEKLHNPDDKQLEQNPTRENAFRRAFAEIQPIPDVAYSQRHLSVHLSRDSRELAKRSESLAGLIWVFEPLLQAVGTGWWDGAQCLGPMFLWSRWAVQVDNTDPLSISSWCDCDEPGEVNAFHFSPEG
jgi:hypothetical protein